MTFPLGTEIDLESIPIDGRFGTKRKYDTHTGVDLYCKNFTPVYAIEAGKRLKHVPFTGYSESPWWNDTDALLIKGESGVILYGEIGVEPGLPEYIEEGQLIGYVLTVLKKDKGLPMTMLHLELYEHDYDGSGEWWREERPEKLKNIEELIKRIK